MLSILRSLAGLPEQIAQGVRTAGDITDRLAELQRLLAARLGSVDQGVNGVLEALPAEFARVRDILEPQQLRVSAIEDAVLRLELQLGTLSDTLERLRGEVVDATEHLPDPDAPGPLARAREALTS